MIDVFPCRNQLSKHSRSKNAETGSEKAEDTRFITLKEEGKLSSTGGAVKMHCHAAMSADLISRRPIPHAQPKRTEL